MSKTLQPRRKQGETTADFAVRLNAWKNEIRQMQGKPLPIAGQKIMASAEKAEDKKPDAQNTSAETLKDNGENAAPTAAAPESVEGFVGRLRKVGQVSLEQSRKKQANATARAQEQERIAAIMARNIAAANGTDEAELAALEADLAKKPFTYGAYGAAPISRTRPSAAAATSATPIPAALGTLPYTLTHNSTATSNNALPAQGAPAAAATNSQQQPVQIQPPVPTTTGKFEDHQERVLRHFAAWAQTNRLFHAHPHDPQDIHAGLTFWLPEIKDPQNPRKNVASKKALTVTPSGIVVHAHNDRTAMEASIRLAVQMYGANFQVGNAADIPPEKIAQIRALTRELLADTSRPLLDHEGKPLSAVVFNGEQLQSPNAKIAVQQPRPGSQGAPAPGVRPASGSGRPTNGAAPRPPI